MRRDGMRRQSASMLASATGVSDVFMLYAVQQWHLDYGCALKVRPGGWDSGVIWLEWLRFRRRNLCQAEIWLWKSIIYPSITTIRKTREITEKNRQVRSRTVARDMAAIQFSVVTVAIGESSRVVIKVNSVSQDLVVLNRGLSSVSFPFFPGSVLGVARSRRGDECQLLSCVARFHLRCRATLKSGEDIWSIWS